MQQKTQSLCAAHILKKMLRKNGAAFSNLAKSGSLQRPRLYSSQPKSESYDAIVVGGGHNGLVSAAYLAKAGMK